MRPAFITTHNYNSEAHMRASERAVQIWPVLVFAAHNRQLLTYELLGRCIGVPRHGLGHLLEPIQSYCLLKKLPALTALVVSNDTGMPSTGFVAAQDVPAEHARVFRAKWLEHRCPTAEEFESAVRELPSNGVTVTAGSPPPP
jgi:hypothetical protein